jgi:Asp-tRNA(Asn)/Glu-tRNA(Gln) amidotransferase A subunit family amidase
MFKQYAHYDAVGLAQLVRGREVSPDELLEEAIVRVERVNSRVNALVNRLYDEARAAIRAGLPDGALRGVPFLLKDLNALCKGSVTSNGCRFFADNLTDHDTELVARYKRGGAVIFGKTNTPEFGLTITTEPKLFGATRNPWNVEFTAGGSSGGAAAAVAAGIVPAAHASDGGGSIRIPASCCGLLGLKPTRGRNPQGPDRGEGWAGMSTEHVITRSVRDSAAFLDMTCGPDAGAPYFAPPPASPFAAEVGRDPGRLCIAFSKHTPNGERISRECEAALNEAARVLEGAGHRLEEAALDFVPPELGPAFRLVIAANIRMAIENFAAVQKRQPSADQFERVTWMFYEAGGQTSAVDYARAVAVLHRTGRLVAAFFQRYDLLLTPTLPREPERIGVFDMNAPDLEAYREAVALFTSFTAPFNASGNPAISVPLYWSETGMPIGIQLAARYGEEAILLRVAAQLEQARPWFDRRAPVNADA